MEWLNQWIAWLSVDGNWIPVAVAGVLGLILGWLFTRIPARRRAHALEAQVSELNTTLRNTKRRADKAEGEVSDLTRQLNNVKSDLEDAEKRLSGLGDDIADKDAALAAISAEFDDAKATLAEREEEIATIEPQLRTREYDLTNLQSDMATLQDEHEQAASAARAELEALAEQYQIAGDDIEALRTDLAAAIILGDQLAGEKEQALLDLEDIKLQDEALAQELTNREIALDETFLRSSHMQRTLEDRETEYANAQAELVDMRRQVDEVSRLKEDMEQKLNHVRGDVASELAVLTTTMVKMKDDALKQANRRNAALATELDTMRMAITDNSQTS